MRLTFGTDSVVDGQIPSHFVPGEGGQSLFVQPDLRFPHRHRYNLRLSALWAEEATWMIPSWSRWPRFAVSSTPLTHRPSRALPRITRAPAHESLSPFCNLLHPSHQACHLPPPRPPPTLPELAPPQPCNAPPPGTGGRSCVPSEQVGVVRRHGSMQGFRPREVALTTLRCVRSWRGNFCRSCSTSETLETKVRATIEDPTLGFRQRRASLAYLAESVLPYPPLPPNAQDLLARKVHLHKSLLITRPA